MKSQFRQLRARRVTITRAECFAKPVLFQPWDDMPKAAQREFETNGPIPCEGGGLPGPWCGDCRFGSVESPEDEY